MKKFELTMRHTVAIVSYIAASMGYSKEEIKYIAGNMKFGSDDIGEFQEILAEPLNGIVGVKRKGEVKDLIQPFNLAERIQMVIDLILKKSNSTETIDMKPTATIYGFSPYKFSNFIRNPKEEPKLTTREEYLRDEALIKKFGEKRLEAIIKERVEKELQKREQLDEERLEMLKIDEALRKAKDATLRGLKGKEVEIPNFKPAPDVASSEEIDEVNQAIEGLIRVRNKLITNLNEQNEEQPKFNWDNIQKAQEQPEPYEPVKFTEEQRQRQREILGNPFASTSRYDQIANEKVRKSSEYSMRLSSEHLPSKTLRNRTEEEAMISRNIEVYPSTNLCKDSLDVNNLKELFSFVRVDGDRLYRINDSSVQPWNRNKPLGSVRLVKGDFGLFNAIKFIVKVDEDTIKEYVDKYFDNPLVVLEAFNNKYGLSITPEDIAVDSSFETPSQYLFRCSYYRVADELKESLKKDRIKLIKGLVRASAIVAMADKELHGWLKGKNPTNS